MAKKQVSAKNGAKKQEDSKEVKEVREVVVSRDAELSASLENLVEKTEDLAHLYETHAKLTNANGKHPRRFIAFAGQLRAKLRLYKKDIDVLKG